MDFRRPGRQDHGVGHRHGGRRVEDHHVGRRLQFLQHLLRPARAQQLGRVGRQRAAGQHPQTLDLCPLHVFLHVPRIGDHQVAEAALVGQSEQAVQVGAAQVGVHQDHPLAVLGQADGQVSRRQGLALGGAGAGDQQALEGPVAPRRELDVGAQGAEGLGGRGLGVLQGHDPPGIALGPRLAADDAD